MEKYLDKLIDNRNIKLWNELKEKFEFILIKSPEPNYMSRLDGETATICIYESDINPAHFTHELLHVYLKLKGVQIVSDFYSVIDNNPDIYYFFSTDLKSHVTNCLEHNLMLPIYLSLGFENHYFISDYKEKKMNNKLMSSLKERYRINGVYDREAIDFYIGKFFAMKTCNNKSFNYSKYYSSFIKLDKKLFKTLNDFWKDWETYDLNDANDNYDEILEYFIEDLNDWQNKKNII
jgi:hypothetical protein